MKKYVRNFKSSYGGKRFLHICKLEWFKSKLIGVDGNVSFGSQGPYRAVNSYRTSQHYFEYRRDFNCMSARVFILLYIIYKIVSSLVEIE